MFELTTGLLIHPSYLILTWEREAAHDPSWTSITDTIHSEKIITYYSSSAAHSKKNNAPDLHVYGFYLHSVVQMSLQGSLDSSINSRKGLEVVNVTSNFRIE